MNIRAQGATEYLIILAVIIVIALVVVGVMGWFPGLGSGINEQQSKTYWQSASPFAIQDWKLTGTATEAELVMQNMTPDKLEIEEVHIDGTDMDLTADVNFSAGERKNAGAFTVGKACTTAQNYSFDVKIEYSTEDGLRKTQTGTKPIVGTCP